MNNEIGETAGAIWHTLNEEGPLSLATLKKQIKASDAILHMALGWLAREGKVAIEADGRSYKVLLT
jgi:hypothetical protein